MNPLKSGMSSVVWLLWSLVFGCAVGAAAQDIGTGPLEARVAELERRQAALEQENRALREQLAALAGAVLRQPAATIQPAALPLPAPAAPQAAPPRAAVAAQEAPPQRVQFGGEIRFRPETRSSFKSGVAVNTVLWQRLRLDARLRLNEHLSGLVQLQDSRFWGQELSTASNEANLDLHQGYIEVANFLGPRVSLRAGRQEISYGNQRLIGAFGWDNVGRSFDAARLTFRAANGFADVIAGRLADRRNTARGEGSQDLIGFYGRIGAANARMGLEPYVLYLRDGQEIAGEVAGLARKSTRIGTYGFRLFGTQGGFGFDLENAFQTGRRGPDTHRAAALAAQARYRFSGALQPEIGFEYDYATGDGKSTDGRSHEFNNLFPTNHLHYGYADYLGWRNMQDFKPYLALQLRSNVRAEIAYHRFLLVEKTGAWKNAGGAVLGLDPSGRLGADLGHEIDLTVTFPLYEHLRILPGYSVFLPGKFARGTQGSRASQFAYWQTLLTF